MNVSLRAVHEALVRGGDPARRWRSLTAVLATGAGPEGLLDTETLRSALRLLDADGSIAEWRTNLGLLGVVKANGRFDATKLHAVGAALDLVGESFAHDGPRSTWAPVATLPPALHDRLRAPPLRHTAGVLLELVDRADRELLLATPFVDPQAVDFLSDALLAAGRRGARTRVVTSTGQARHFEDVARRWVSEDRAPLRVTEMQTELSALGSHAKVVLVDGERGYVGSANLTAAGLGRHIEIGVELAGVQVADLVRVLVALERAGTPAIAVGGTVHPR